MQRNVALVVTILLALASSSSVNYCGSKMCGNTDAHTFCQFPEGPSLQCVGYMPAQLSLEEKARVMARLNRRRNEAAAGRLRGLPNAGNMLKLRWVEELAREAQRWADQCRPPRMPEEHDVCRDLYSIPVGQCIASVVGEAPGLRVESMIDMWYMQSILYKGNVTFYVMHKGSYYGDFGQMMWSRTYMVGCGRSRFMANRHGRLRSVERLVCNFAPKGPVPGRPLWAPALPHTACPPRAVPDPGFNSLCNFQEHEEITFLETSMALEEHMLLNTVLEIENNHTLDYLGSLDEIYLTRLAIATIRNTITTQSLYNAVQRREIVEIFDLEDISNLISKPVMETNYSATAKTNNSTAKANSTSKKIILVGRPKSYNVEELTDHDHKADKYYFEDVSLKQKGGELEYEFLETEESTIMTSKEPTSATIELQVINETTNVVSTERNAPIEEVMNSTETTSNISNTLQWFYENVAVESTTQQPVNQTPFVDKSIDDYLSDPETVRQLQEALDRMEHTLEAQQTTEKPEKVRRDIPEQSEELDRGIVIDAERFNAELERNKSIERGPMLNMALKYLPYLKHYENGFLGRSAANVLFSNCVCSYCLVLYCFCYDVLLRS